MFPCAPDIDLTTLRWSMVVARSGGFRSAAVVLGVEQSAVSRRVRRLEDDLGVSLFHRTPRGASPTNAGRHFLRRMDILFAGLNLAISDARSAGVGQVGRLRIGLSFSSLSDALFQLISRFHNAHPSVGIEMVEGRAEDHLQALIDQYLDIAVLPGGMTVTGLDVSVLWRETLMLAMPQDHALSTKEIVRKQDLAGLRLWVSERDIGRAAFAGLGGNQDLGPDILIVEAGAALLLEQARMGLGLTVIGSGSMTSFRSDPGLVLRPLDLDPNAPLAVSAAWSSRNDNPVLRRFVSSAGRL